MEFFMDFTGRRLYRLTYAGTDLEAVLDDENLATLCDYWILRENPFFYCQPCRSLIKSCGALLLHANSDSHKKVTFCWRRCLDLLSEGVVEDAEGTQSILDETKKSPLRGLNDIVLIRDPNTKQVRHWVCTVCFTFGSADDLLIQHLASLVHIDRIAESVLPELNKPCSPAVELFSKRHFELKMVDKERLLKRKTQPGVFRSYQSPWLQDWEFDSPQRESEEKAWTKSFLADFMTNPQEFSLSYENVATKNSILALECKARQLNDVQKYTGTEYIVEIWLPRGKLIPLFYCCLCNSLSNDWKQHADSKMHKGTYDIVKEALENKSELWPDKNPIVAAVIQLEMSPFDCFLPIRAINFLCGIEKLAPQLWELIKSVKSSFRTNSKADEIKSAVISSQKEHPKIEPSGPKNRPEPVFKTPLPPAKTSPCSSSPSSSQLGDEFATSIPPLPRAPELVSQTNFNQLTDRVNLFYDLLIKQAEIIERNNRIIAYFNFMTSGYESKFDENRLSDESAANKQRLAGFGAEFDPFFQPFQLNSLPLHFKNHVLKVVEWFDSYVTQVLMPLGRRDLRGGGAADVAAARLRDWTAAYPEDRPTVEKAVRVLITILSARIQSFYRPIDEDWSQKISCHLDLFANRIFENHDIIMKREEKEADDKRKKAAQRAAEKDGRRGTVSEPNRPNLNQKSTMKNGSVDSTERTTKKRWIIESADGKSSTKKSNKCNETGRNRSKIKSANRDDDEPSTEFHDEPPSSVKELKKRRDQKAYERRSRDTAVALGLSMNQYKKQNRGRALLHRRILLLTTVEFEQRIIAARQAVLAGSAPGNKPVNEGKTRPDLGRNSTPAQCAQVLEALEWCKKWCQKIKDGATERFSRLEARQALKWAEQLKTKNAIPCHLQLEVDIIAENIRRKLSQLASHPIRSRRQMAPTPLFKSAHKAAAWKKLKWAVRFSNKLPVSTVAAARKISRKKNKCRLSISKKLRTKSNGPTEVCPKIKRKHSDKNLSSALKSVDGGDDDDECCIIYETNMESEEEIDAPSLT